ncbi:hypothetical protein DUNSADRAFT_15178 [Dunaliella salina]|uniref:Uncharacterized protein n=1 Tax=Dunaliella salina TaxID=3046 RepID=A0ABQ7G5Z8_DUNSA|nr:hypothetical protein DUNSADRAFT_15178 [Dunaliella salina]|eukprot:KAF5830004.1 hypothetical protein DUNSADRAFT_15178 [Dunaliella salina]
MRKDAANYRAVRDLAAHEAHLSATGRKKAHTSGELRAQASSSGPFALGAARSPPRSSRPSRYHTHLRRVKIQVQLDIDVDPGSLPNITALLQMLAARLPSGWVVDAAVRHGCVLVSLEVALPVQAANLPEGPAGNVSSSTLSSAGLLAELSDSVRSSAVDWASTVLSRMEPQTQELAPRLSLQMEDHKEVWVLDHHLREWCPGPDTAPLPQQGLFQLRVPRLALTWPHQAPQQYQQEGFQSRPASCPPAAAGAAFAAHPVRFEACLHAPWAAVQQGVHGWQGVPALDDPAWAAGQLVVLVRQAWGKYLPVQLEALHIVETVGSDAGPEAAAGTASATALAAKQHLRAACRFQVSVSIPTDALTEGGADRPWSLLHLELSVRENLLESCPIMFVPPQHADVAAELAAADAELGVLAFLHDLAEWLHLRGCMPGTACQPQLGSQDQAALMHAMGQDLLMSAQHWDMPALVCLLRAGLGNEEGWLVTRAGQQGTGQALPPRTAAAAAAAAVAAAATAAAGSLAPPGSSSTRVLSRAASAVTGAACISSRAADGDLAPWGPGGHPVAHVCARLQAGKQSRGRNREHAVAAKGELSIMQAEFWVGHLLTAMVVVVIAAAALHVVVT